MLYYFAALANEHDIWFDIVTEAGAALRVVHAKVARRPPAGAQVRTAGPAKSSLPYP